MQNNSSVSSSKASPVKVDPKLPRMPITSTSETPVRMTRRKRAVVAPETPQMKTASRPLKNPTRTRLAVLSCKRCISDGEQLYRSGIPQISRTFRAMIRQCYNQRVKSNKEIAEFCNCDVRDVYFAINNESGDDLDEDQDYLDGKLGDIVNIDDIEDYDAEDRTGLRADSKADYSVDTTPQDEPMDEPYPSIEDRSALDARFPEDRRPNTQPHKEMEDEPMDESYPNVKDESACDTCSPEDYEVPEIGSRSQVYPTPESDLPSDNSPSEHVQDVPDAPEYDSAEEVDRDCECYFLIPLGTAQADMIFVSDIHVICSESEDEDMDQVSID
jgi:hypothetical protein